MDSDKIIDSFGGTGCVARIFGVTKGAASQWRKNGIPKHALLHMRSLRPDLFADTLRTTAKKAA